MELGTYMLVPPFSDTADLPEDYEEVEVNRAPNAGNNSAAEQGSNVPVGWKPTAAKPVPVIRCTANKRDGTQCKKWSIRGATVCARHGGQLPNVKEHARELREAATLRILGLADMAIDTIEELAESTATPAAVKLKAATEILDRAGVKGGADVQVQVEIRANPAEEIAKRLASIAENLKPKEVEQEELVDEGEKSDD